MAECHNVEPTGKWRRAISFIEDTQTAQESSIVEVAEIGSPLVNVPNTESNDNIVDLYSVGHKEVTREMCNKEMEVLFQHTLQILGPQEEIVRVAALFDGCTMVLVMCETVFEKVKHRIGEWSKSKTQLRMGNGVLVPSVAIWKGKMRLGEVTIEGEFEVFNSGGSWGFLLGKPLLRMFQAEQAYGPDTVSIGGKNDEREILHNEITMLRTIGEEPGVNLTLDVKQRDIKRGGPSDMKPPPREVLKATPNDPTTTDTDEMTYSVYVTSNKPLDPDPNSVLTRETDPYKPERVNKIIQEVTIGPDVTEDQRKTIQEILGEYADCFALSIKEVNAIPGATHRLNIPEGSTFRTKIPPRSYNLL